MILTKTGGSDEVIQNNDIGILINNEYGDITNLYSEYLDEMAYNQRSYQISEELAKAMTDFADNRAHWKEAGKGGREKIFEFYDFKDVVSKYEKVFQEILEDKN